jgi:hypothetical protein
MPIIALSDKKRLKILDHAEGDAALKAAKLIKSMSVDDIVEALSTEINPDAVASKLKDYQDKARELSSISKDIEAVTKIVINAIFSEDPMRFLKSDKNKRVTESNVVGLTRQQLRALIADLL